MKSLLDNIVGRRILVVGDLMLDRYTWGDASRISPEAPVPVVDVSRESRVAGGAANVALNLRSLGAESEVCGWVGRDAAGMELAELLGEANISIDPIFHAHGRITILKTRIMVRNQQLCRLDREDIPAGYAFDAENIARVVELASGADAVIFSDYGKGTLSEELITALVNCRDDRLLLAMDPKPRRRIAHRGLSLLTPNRSEALQLAGLEVVRGDPFPETEVCRRIYETYQPENLVVTMGGEGMLVSRAGEVSLKIPTMAREVFDVSGAGDTVVAALTLALSAGAEIEKAARFANLAAGIVVGKVGTATVAPSELLSLRESL
jgi:rfaE bifunctional protein kinase chain/domain